MLEYLVWYSLKPLKLFFVHVCRRLQINFTHLTSPNLKCIGQTIQMLFRCKCSTAWRQQFQTKNKDWASHTRGRGITTSSFKNISPFIQCCSVVQKIHLHIIIVKHVDWWRPINILHEVYITYWQTRLWVGL